MTLATAIPGLEDIVFVRRLRVSVLFLQISVLCRFNSVLLRDGFVLDNCPLVFSFLFSSNTNDDDDDDD